MQSKKEQNMIFMRLFTDEDVNDKIKQACEQYKVKTAVVISGIGQLKNAELGYFKKKGDYSPETFDAPHELLSLTGNICQDEEGYLLHLHAVIGDEKKNTFGGHFIGGLVDITSEIVLLKTNMDVNRILDDETGLKSMNLK